MKFKDKNVVITGAPGGIGTALTTRFLAEGAKVCAVDINEQALQKLKSELGNPKELICVEADISSDESCNNLFKELHFKWVVVDILINNAGWYPFTPFEEVTHEQWRKVISVNLDGPFLVTKSILPLLKKSKSGRVINVSSGSIFMGSEAQCHYVAAKAGVIGYTRSAAEALGKYNITVNAITPGLTSTSVLVASVSKEMIEKNKENGILKREQKANDLVGAFVFLASDDASFITGQTVNVDGGRRFL